MPAIAADTPNGDATKAATTSTTTADRQDTDDRQISFHAKLSLDCLLYFIKAIVFVYTIVSLPFFYFYYRVWEKKHDVEAVVRSQRTKTDDNTYVWQQINIDPHHQILENRVKPFETYDQLIQASIKSFGDRLCFGYRRTLQEQRVKRSESDSKMIRQVALSDYIWINYEEFERIIEATRRGLLLEGVKAGDKVVIYSDTRPEWQITSQALIRIGAVVVTMYSTLGVDGIVHCLEETGVTHIVAQQDKVKKLLNLKSRLPKVKKIIYFSSTPDIPDLKETPKTNSTSNKVPNSTNNNSKTTILNNVNETNISNKTTNIGTNVDKNFEHPEVEFTYFNDLLKLGSIRNEEINSKVEKLEKEGQEVCSKRNKDTIAVIMYTSGSTGIPKGVLITHGNIMATIKSFTYVVKDFVYNPSENICTAYLPLAHIFEFCIQTTMIFHGVRFGFGTPHTLTDKSPGLIPGQKGDLTLLQPTVMIIVPLVLDRIAQGIKQALKVQSYFKEQLVTFLINYKMYWQRHYYETPLVNKIVCSKIATALGGKAKYVICGSAPLSGATQNFIKAALNIKLPQGYGATETCAATNCQLFDDQSTNNVGIPVSNCYIKLEPWYEANYCPNDKPNPRGEIVVGGESITAGYFNLDELTKEAFYTDSKGIRWYRTGDIGEFLPNGNLRIIDRKKDLVKLQNGEYISLGKVESTFKSNPYTDNFCVYANSHYNYIVALAPANELGIRSLAQQIVDSYSRNLTSVSSNNNLLTATWSTSSPDLPKSASSPDLPNGVDAVVKENKQSWKRQDNDRLPLLSKEKDELKLAIAELHEVLASYESDKLNNNNDETNDQDNNDSRARAYSDRKSSINSTVGGINERLQRLCDNKLIKERVMSYIQEVAEERSLTSLEVPKRLLLLAEEWTEDKNLVTAAMKIKRNYVYKRYEKEIDQLYSGPQEKPVKFSTTTTTTSTSSTSSSNSKKKR